KQGERVVPLLHHAVQCADAWPFHPGPAPEDPRLPLPSADAQQSAACAAVAVTPSPASVREVPEVAVPALVLAGAWETSGDPGWADDLADRWPLGTAWIAPDAGHGVLRTPCGAALARAWLAEP